MHIYPALAAVHAAHAVHVSSRVTAAIVAAGAAAVIVAAFKLAAKVLSPRKPKGGGTRPASSSYTSARR